MTLERLDVRPGVVKSNSSYTQPGRYIDSEWCRFSAGFPEKRGGRAKLDDTLAALRGSCRGITQWRSNSEVNYVAFGTTNKLYIYGAGELIDATPLRGRTTGTLTNKLTTSSGSSLVSINSTAHNLAANDWVMLTATVALDGITLAGLYTVDSVTDANNYVVDSGTVATGSTSGGGGAVAYTYYLKLLGSAPFATTNGSPLVTVTDTSHGCIAGDTVIFSGATAVAGLTISGSYIIQSSASDNTYVITAGSNANATTTGGGTAVVSRNEITGGLVGNADFFGYGLGAYGAGFYGTIRSHSKTLALRTWSLHAYGEWLLANPNSGALYKWDPSHQDNVRAVELYNAPTQMYGFFVTPERYIIALGTDGDSLKMRWPDQLDPTAWTATETNTANESRKVQGGSTLIAGRSIGGGLNLIWTETQLFTHQWRADDYVFTTLTRGSNNGIYGPNAACVMGDICYWVGEGHFWKWDGAVNELPSDDVRDWFFSHVDRTQRAKVFVAPISNKSEIIILYQEQGASEINRYLLYNTVQQCWTCGTIAVTAWLDMILFSAPISVTSDGIILYEETGLDDYDGTAIDSYIEAGPQDVQNGERNLDLWGFWPDFERQTGNITLTVRTKEENTGDTTVDQTTSTIAVGGAHVDLRGSGKLIGYKLESNVVGGDWRFGVHRVDADPGGAR